MRKIQYLFTATLLFLSISLNAQEETSTPPETLTDAYLKTLVKVPESEMRSGKYKMEMRTVRFYDTDKKRIDSQNRLIKLLTSGDYGADPYANSSNQVVVALLRPSTDEERAQMKRQMEASKVGNPSELVGQDAKPFELKDMDGKTYTMEELKGKVVVLNFWFIGCPPCRKEIPELNELVKENSSDEIVFLGVATDRKRELSKFLAKTDFNYNIVPQGRSFAAAYNVSAYPTHIVIGKDSKIAYGAQGFGPGSIDMLTEAVEKALEAK
ncbi:MAG: TlpA disulfide reductase family protein [Nonlabens sp.]